ncbi:isoprenylcysteine carboxylmethyltransferase family protein [Candidatus Fermentibacteria bacterium]|nr:isoprenylcysteine carboxylmethyltransferase family protein [Candidatus Fermentibacteria bacterium]
MTERRGIERAGKAGGWAAAIAMMVLLAEVVWMVLPFVGFISLHVTMDPFFRFRRRWFQPFFMRSYHPAGAPLVLIGMGLFLSGAMQIYGRKLKGGGAVTGGLYRWVRHPQYASLAVVGLGLLLLWPRYYLLLAFVTMCFLYVALARAEERQMLKEAGDGYRSYLSRTSMFFPGDRHILRIGPPGPASWIGALRGVGWWALAMILAFAAALGVSALTILHRPLPLVHARGIVGLDRRVFYPGSVTRGENLVEFFGRDALERRSRRELQTEERLVTCLNVLGEDPRVRQLLGAVQAPATVMAIPLEPDRPMFEEEERCQEGADRVLRIYLVAAAAKRNRDLATHRAFDGYLRDKEVKLVISSLVDVDAARIRQVIQVRPSRAFYTTWDRLLDKQTF